MSTYNGIAIYKVIDNGNFLVGYFTNTESRSENECDIVPEIATKKRRDDNGVNGEYRCEYNNQWCTLIITPNENSYNFVWKNGTHVLWTGIGINCSADQIAVSYVD